MNKQQRETKRRKKSRSSHHYSPEQLAFSVRQASQESTLSVPYLYKLMQRGDLRYTKIGERRVIPRQALLDLIEGKS